MMIDSDLVENAEYFKPSITKDWKPPYIYNYGGLFWLALWCGLLATTIFCTANAIRFQIDKRRIGVLIGCGILAMGIQVLLWALCIGGKDEWGIWAFFFSRSAALFIWWDFHRQTKKRYMLHEMLGRPTDVKAGLAVLVSIIGLFAEIVLANVVKGVFL